MQQPVKDQKRAALEQRQQSPKNGQQSLAPTAGLVQRLHELPAARRVAEMQAIQRSAGNRAAQQIVASARTDQPLDKPQSDAPPKDTRPADAPKQQSQSSPVIQRTPDIQRTVVDDKDSSNVLLDGSKERAQSVETIAAYIYLTRSKANPHAMMPPLEDLYDAVDDTYDSLIEEVVLSEHPYSMAETVRFVNSVAHSKWLKAAEKTVEPDDRLPGHEELSEGEFNGVNLKHYNLFDKKMLWRWTSKPSTEQVYTAKRKNDEARTEITYAEIVRVVAAHSGGNDKSNPYVKTLSFGRNPAALMGVAASAGGDKHVLNIIDKTEYLYGIDINSLEDKGITAHAATARMISLFESEYVLVSTPGFPSTSLDELATVKYRNPFKGVAIDLMNVPHEEMEAVVKQMGKVKPEKALAVRRYNQKKAALILDRALKAKNSANYLKETVQDKEPLDWRFAPGAMDKYALGPGSMGPGSMWPGSMGPGSMRPSSMGAFSMGPSSLAPRDVGRKDLATRSKRIGPVGSGGVTPSRSSAPGKGESSSSREKSAKRTDLPPKRPPQPKKLPTKGNTSGEPPQKSSTPVLPPTKSTSTQQPPTKPEEGL